MELNEIEYEGLIITDYNLEVPLDYTNDNSEKISIFARKVSREENLKKSLPYLIFFQGGPGYESPRPVSDSGWIKRASKEYNVILIDQRGTGLSNPISIESIKDMDDNQIAEYLTFFRADNIVRDAELLRRNIFKVEKWSVLGQSFGGFCAMNYLSFHSDHLQKVFITGGIPPLDAHPDDIYRATYKRVMDKNRMFYKNFPKAKLNAKKIADYLDQNTVHLPNGDLLSVKRFQQLGLNLGFSDGMAILNYLFERAFINGRVSNFFLKQLFTLQTFDTNPLFTIIHEACYAQGFATEWSAHRIIKEYPDFIYKKSDSFYFTGEMLYPWMLDEYSSLRPFKNAANILANKKDWPHLYSKEKLRENQVPIAAAVYTNDMYVDRDFSIKLAEIIPNMNVWETKLLEHNALRSNGEKVLDSLFTRIP